MDQPRHRSTVALRCSPAMVPLCLVLVAAPPALAQDARYPIVPLPARLTPAPGELAITARTRLVIADRAFRPLAARTRAVLGEAAGIGIATASRPSAGAIVLRRDPAVADSEGYRLDVWPDSAVIRARTPRGASYGVTSLAQLIRRTATGAEAPAVHVADAPRFVWRGMHLDVSRHLFPVAFIERYIDLLARYKLNTFHWHLTDDQGWRLAIRRYPRLTSVGGWRRETIVDRQFDPYVGDATRYGGFYSQAEVRAIVRYAAERFVTIVPEIEMPGHAMAALAAYPELACTPGPFEVATRWGVFDDVYCPTETTFAFLENVLRETMALFPGAYIHIGGDEVPKRRWRESAEVQALMVREHLATPEDVQSWFVRRIQRFLGAHHRRLVGWDEILEGGLPPDATVMSWRGTAGGIAAARAGHDVVMSPGSHAYFDYYQGDPRFEPLAIGGFTPLARVYAFEPVPDSLTPGQARHILGAQGNVWTEYMATSDAVEYMALPRMLAMAEVTWTPRDRRDWTGFLARLPDRLRELDRLGVNYRIPHVSGLEDDRLLLRDTAVVALATGAPDAIIHYSLDGSDPTAAAPRYSSPLVLPVTAAGVVVTARAFLPNGRASAPRAARFTRTTLRAAASVDRAALAPGLRVRRYAGRFARTADLDTAAAADAGAGPVRIPDGLPAEDYGLQFDGYVDVPADGLYRFRLASDDGSVLRIGERIVVDNDGLHGTEEQSGWVALRAGLHPIAVRFFQRGGGVALSLAVEREDGTAVPLEGRLVHRK